MDDESSAVFKEDSLAAEGAGQEGRLILGGDFGWLSAWCGRSGVGKRTRRKGRIQGCVRAGENSLLPENTGQRRSCVKMPGLQEQELLGV